VTDSPELKRFDRHFAAMSRYFFDTAGDEPVRDPSGIELAGPEEARRYAIKYAGHCIADEPEQVSDAEDFKVEVRDRDGLHLFTVTACISVAPEPVPKR